MNTSLFSSCELAGLPLKNRVVMAPMTRCRADADHLPTAIMARYYAQRAGAGLIVTEGVAPAPEGAGYARIPGIYSPAQVVAWANITDAVHRAGGRLFMQLMHTGRASHPANMPSGTRVLAPSAVALSGTIWTDSKGLQPYPTPEAMTESEILAAVEMFAQAAERAVEAGCDGVELHGANGYLIDQFLNTASNQRNDGWGGTPAGRIRFALAVADAVIARIGSMKTGIRISPFGVFNDMKSDPDMPEVFTLLARELSQRNLAYIHIVDHSSMGAPAVGDDIKRKVQQSFRGALILSGGYDRPRAEADLDEGHADLIAFGRPFISNPDLVTRLEQNLPLAEPKASSFYTPGESGYIDYPAT